MAPAISFDATTKRGVLERCASSDAPQILRVTCDRPAADAVKVVEIAVGGGELIGVRAGRWEGTDALLWVALATGGRVEIEPAPKIAPRPTKSFDEAYAEAELAGRALEDHLGPLGGIGAVVVADLDRLSEQLASIPDAANAVLRAVDGKRTVAGIAFAVGFEPALTARILSRLSDMGVLRVGEDPDPLLPAPSRPGITSDAIPPTASHWEPPAEGWGETSALPGEEELEAEEEIAGWLSAEDAPPPLLSDDAFTNAFAAVDPTKVVAEEIAHDAETPRPIEPEDPTPRPAARVRERMPISTRRPEPAGAPDDDDEVMRDAGVGGGGMSPGVLVAVGAMLLIGLVLIFSRSSGPDAPPDAGVAPPPPPPPVVTTTTATVATATITESPDGQRPTIAGPDAPEDVKRAERLLDAGRYREAGELLSQLRRSRPDDAAVFVLSGQVYVDTGRLGPANSMADRAIAIDSRSYRAWVLKGSVEQFRGRKSQAIKAYERAMKLGPNHPMAPEIESVLSELRR